MANRDITNYREVVQQVASKPVDTIGLTEDIGKQIIKQSQEAKVTENFSKAQLDISALTEQHRIDYEADPFNEQGLQKYNAAKEKIINSYGSDISPFFKADWLKSTEKLATGADANLQSWQYQQAAKNAKISISKDCNAH